MQLFSALVLKELSKMLLKVLEIAADPWMVFG